MCVLYIIVEHNLRFVYYNLIKFSPLIKAVKYFTHIYTLIFVKAKTLKKCTKFK